MDFLRRFGLFYSVLAIFLAYGPAEARRKPKACPQEVAEAGRKQSVAVRNPADIQELTIIAYNLLNLERHVGKYEGNVRVREPQNKDERFRRIQGEILREVGADVGIFEEVEDRTALEQFFGRNAGGLYRAMLIKGNDHRGIDIGFGIKTDLPFEIEHRTYKNMTWFDPIAEEKRPLFSRDLPVLIFRLKDQAKPLLVVVGTHYKSKRDRDEDDESRTLRKAQVDGTVTVIKGLQKEFGQLVPIVFGGDANGNPNKEAEYANLKKALALEDVFDLVEPPLTREQRITHTFHPQGEAVKQDQLDVLMVTPALKACVKIAYVYRYKDENGNVKPIPKTIKQRKQNPSDHFPVVLTLDFQCILRLWSGN